MISSALFDEILVEPVKKGCNKLYIVSGYATSAPLGECLIMLALFTANSGTDLVSKSCQAGHFSLSVLCTMQSRQ